VLAFQADRTKPTSENASVNLIESDFRARRLSEVAEVQSRVWTKGVKLITYAVPSSSHHKETVIMNIQGLHLREVLGSDLAKFFNHQRDSDARHMAAFTSEDGDDQHAFMSHWHKILSDASILMRTIELDGGDVAGSIGSYVDVELGAPEVTYWIGKNYWGQGIASRALGQFLEVQSERPLYARVAKDNVRSVRVLEKHNFRPSSEAAGFAAARGKQVEEFVMKLNAQESK